MEKDKLRAENLNLFFGNKQILKAGDVFHVPSNVIHGAVCLEKGVLVDVFSPMREDFFN